LFVFIKLKMFCDAKGFNLDLSEVFQSAFVSDYAIAPPAFFSRSFYGDLPFVEISGNAPDP
jgi:hypothetical protein